MEIARQGGQVAKNTRNNIEDLLKEQIISNKNN